MKEPKTMNERYYMSTGKYKSDRERKENEGKGKWGKEWKPFNINKSLTGY